MAQRKLGPNENLFRSEYNGYFFIRGKLESYMDVMENQVRSFIYSSDEYADYYRDSETDIVWNKAIYYGLSVHIDFYGYDNSGNKKVHKEKSERIYAHWLFTRSHTTFWNVNDKPYDENVLPNKIDWEFYSSHDSQWLYNLERPLMKVIEEKCNNMLPKTYWRNPNHSKTPFSFHIRNGMGMYGFGKKCAAHVGLLDKRMGNSFYSEPKLEKIMPIELVGLKDVKYRHGMVKQIEWRVKDGK